MSRGLQGHAWKQEGREVGEGRRRCRSLGVHVANKEREVGKGGKPWGRGESRERAAAKAARRPRSPSEGLLEGSLSAEHALERSREVSRKRSPSLVEMARRRECVQGVHVVQRTGGGQGRGVDTARE